jgi:hypothetical protein
VPVDRHRFIRLVGEGTSVNRTPGGQAAGVGRTDGCTTNLTACPDGTPVTPEFVIGAHHRLFQIGASFRMSTTISPPGRSTTTTANRSKRTSRSLRGPADRRPHRLVDPAVRARGDTPTSRSAPDNSP